MNRFLRYSLEHGRPIRAVFLLGEQMVQKTVTVLAVEAGNVTLKIGAKKTPILVPIGDVFSCDYARGDRGED